MRRLPWFALFALSLLAACTLGLPDGGVAKAPAAALSAEITVTPLGAPGGDAPAPLAEAAPAPAALTPPATGLAPVTALAPTDTAPNMTADQVAPAASDAPLPDSATVAATPPVAAPVVPEVLKSPTQIACEKKGGRFSKAGASGAYVCEHQTRDGGKRCSKESDCQGLCLARSGTCSPVTPLFGCQEIFQQDGLRVTQCME